jgi:UDP-glucose 4-epimerase
MTTENVGDNQRVQRSVIITGAGGFLAGHCVAAFDEAGWRTIGIGRSDPNRQAERLAAFYASDLGDAQRIASLLEQHAPDALVHLAAPASVPQSLRHPSADFRGHVEPSVNVLEAVRLAAASTRVVLVSSAAVYGDPESLPVSEDAPLAPISPYGFHKLHQELLLREYVQLHGVNGCVARVFSTYGENLRRLAIWEMTRRALAGHYDVLGSGQETRDYLYAGDVGRALVVIAEKATGAINVASGEEVSMREVAERVYEAAGIRDKPNFTGEVMRGSPAHWRADVTRLRALGFAPPAWRRGLEQTVRWIQGRE